MSISALSAGLSGLTSNQSALDITANNIANSNTPGFQPKTAAFQESAPAGAGVSISAAGRSLAANAGAAAAGANGVDLAHETVDSLSYKNAYDFSAKVVQNADQAVGSLINTSA